MNTTGWCVVASHLSLGSDILTLGAHAATVDVVVNWWKYFLVLIAVAASWSGVPFLGATAASAAGVAASQGDLHLAVVVIVILIGGETGGAIGYHIGLRWGRQLIQRPGRHQAYRERILRKGEHAYEKWGRLAVFFTPAIVSGTAKMRRGQFLVWNFVDVIGFTFATVGAAYGIARLSTGHHGVDDVLILVLGVSLGGLLLYLVRRHRKHSMPTRPPTS